MSSLRSLFLDGAGVILETTPWLERFMRAVDMRNLRVEAADILRAEKVVVERQQRHWSRVLSLAEEESIQLERYAIVLAELCIPDPDGSLKSELNKTCFWLNHTRLFPDVREVLSAFTNQGVKIGLISNAPPSMKTALARLGIESFFETVIISSCVGLRKPDAAIYRLALDKSGVSPANAVFVDDQEEHVLGACRIGMWGLLMDRPDSQTDSHCTRIRNLHEVSAWLGG